MTRAAATLTACGLGLSRNQTGLRFPHAEQAEALEEFRAQVLDVLASEDADGWKAYELQEASSIDVALLVERGLMTPRFADAGGAGRGFAIYGEGEASLEINGEDHLRLLGFRVGDQLPFLWSLLSLLDDRLEAAAPYAFDAQWGYLTSHPEQAGTGLRAYATLHAPALTFAGRLPGIALELLDDGLGLAPLWGGAGGVVQVSNLGRQGKPERETIKQIEEVSVEILEKERSVRKMLFRSNPTQVKDHIGRAIGVGQHAWNISFAEAVNVVSAADVGVELGVAVVPGMDGACSFSLMQKLQPAHLIVEHMESGPGSLEDPEIDNVRARVLREVFADARVR